jgi:hypothetical protein
MTDFLLIFRSTQQAEQTFADASPEEMQAEMERWNVWTAKLAEAGQLGGGEPLHFAGKVVRERGKKVTDGPFIEGKEMVGGYLFIHAADLAQATELAKGCPALLAEGGTVEIREILKME